MGTYATTSAMQVLMVGTTFDTVTSALASKCIDLAESRIKQALTTRYDVSDFNVATAVPPMVTSWCERLACGYAYRFLSRGAGDTTNRDKAYIQSVEDELKLLMEGKISIVDTSGSELAEALGVLCDTDSYTTTFNEDDPIYWNIDSDKLDAIEDDRE